MLLSCGQLKVSIQCSMKEVESIYIVLCILIYNHHSPLYNIVQSAEEKSGCEEEVHLCNKSTYRTWHLNCNIFLVLSNECEII